MRRGRLAVGATALAVAAVALAAGPSAARPPITRPLFANLTGAAERPKGDPNGAGAAIFVPRGATTLCYSIVVVGITKPNAAHIHRGAAGVAGDVVIPLNPPKSGNGGIATGCANAPRALVAEIRSKSGRFYVNVHTADFPGGAVRGQLSAR